ncbi:uncharacterized protein LOC124445958 [Xenia sp. Carnegie-2017]|uniref:uncharacterized protein LOC124445958 n=1 Tax=Xenia sp. Carnegie-2017 TaxID=2897299 RepID=UPI001F04F2D8|nr:uncharacterized protein LOC124445958 [Xenia sp. Carnegie-2017]
MRIRTINKTSTLLKHFYQFSLANEGRRPGVNDVDCLLEHEKATIYVLELQNKPVGKISIIEYGSNLVYLGSFFIHKDYRYLGHGKRFLQAVWERLDENPEIKNKAWYTLPVMAEFYKTFGGVDQWTVGLYDLNVTRSLEKLQSYSSHFQLNQINENNIHDVLAYDNKVFGYPREKFLRMWLSTPGTHARAAFNKDGQILGYVVVRLTFFPEEGYKVGPLYCEDIEVGKSLIKSVFEDINDHGFSHSNSIVVESPTERNPKAKELMEFLDGEYNGAVYYQTTNGLPNSCFDHWFGLLSFAYG